MRRPFLSLLGESEALDAAPAGRRVLKAVRHLPALSRRRVKDRPLLPREVDADLVPAMWRRAVFSNAKPPQGAVDRDAYVVCVLEQQLGPGSVLSAEAEGVAARVATGPVLAATSPPRVASATSPDREQKLGFLYCQTSTGFERWEVPLSSALPPRPNHSPDPTPHTNAGPTPGAPASPPRLSRLRRLRNWFDGLSETGKVGIVAALITTVGGGVFGVTIAVVPLFVGGGGGGS
ncbi:hypothetical protein GCM10023324_38170 [Streptomyces youssoufiensis]